MPVIIIIILINSITWGNRPSIIKEYVNPKTVSPTVIWPAKEIGKVLDALFQKTVPTHETTIPKITAVHQNLKTILPWFISLNNISESGIIILITNIKKGIRHKVVVPVIVDHICDVISLFTFKNRALKIAYHVQRHNAIKPYITPYILNVSVDSFNNA